MGALESAHARTTTHSEEAIAAARVVLGLTAAVSCVGGTIGLISGHPMLVLTLPAAGLVISIVRHHHVAAGWWGSAVWALLLPMAPDAGALPALAMLVGCVAIAVGPERLGRWAAGDYAGGQRHPPRPPHEGWIEEVR